MPTHGITGQYCITGRALSAVLRAGLRVSNVRVEWSDQEIYDASWELKKTYKTYTFMSKYALFIKKSNLPNTSGKWMAVKLLLTTSICHLFSVYLQLPRLLRFAIDFTLCPVTEVNFQRREMKKNVEGVSSSADFDRMILWLSFFLLKYQCGCLNDYIRSHFQEN